MCIIHGITFTEIDPVGIMADRAWSAFFHDVFTVSWKTFVGQDTGSAVATVTQVVSRGAFRDVIARSILPHQKEFVIGPMRTRGSDHPAGAPIVAVTIAAIHERGRCERGDQAGDVGIAAGRLDRMIRWTGR